MRGCPGIAPRSSSSRLGLVAAVSETDSPSQLRPLVSQSTWTIRRSTSRPWPVKSTGSPHAPTAASAGTLVAAGARPVGERGEVLVGSAVQMQRAVAARDQPGLREPREGVRDRRPLRADEPPEQAMRERQREADAAGLDPPPAPGQVPEQQRQPDLEARLRGDRALDVEVGGARAGAGEQRVGDLRPRLDALRERIVEQGEPRRHQRVPGRFALEQVVGARGERLQHVAVADDLGGGAVADAHVDAERAVDHEHARPVADLRRSSARGRSRRPARRTPTAVTTCRATRRMRRSSSRREVVVEVEQVVVRRGRQRSRCSRVRASAGHCSFPALMLPVEQRWRAPGTVVRAVDALVLLDVPG